MRWWADLPGKLLGPMFTLDAVRVGRRQSTFVTRWVYLAGLVVILAIFFWGWTSRMDRSAAAGRVPPAVLARFAEEFFWLYAVTQFLVVVALTPAFTAAAITDEKERKTLDFLLVTALSAREIVFGKLAARAGMLFTLVLAGLPILSFMQFFGGIDPELLLIVTGMTLVTVVSMAAVGLACSVVLDRTRDAVVLAYVLPLIYVIGSSMWAADAASAARQNTDWAVPVGKYTITGDGAARAVAAGNPFLASSAINGRSAMAANSGETVAWYCGSHLLLAAAGFASAALRLRGAARAGGGGVAARGKVRQVFARLGGHRTTARPHPAVTDDPVAWREVYVEPGSGSGVARVFFRFVVVGLIVWSFVSIVGTAFLSPARGYGPSNPWGDFQARTKVWVGSVSGGLGVLLLLGATVRGAGSVAGEKDRDTWTNLLTTPLSAGEILWGKWWGSILGQRHAIYLLGGVWAVGVLTGSVNPLAVALTAVALGVYLTAFAWLGVSCSVNARNARSAITRAVPQAIFFGGGFWLFLGCCCAAGAAGGAGAVGNVAGFIAGATPTVVLFGLPLVDAKALESVGKSGGPYAFLIAAGGVAGAVGWFVAAIALKKKSLTLMEREANREGFERPPGGPPRPADPQRRRPDNDW